MKKLLGSSLRPEVQRDALARYVQRFTGDHKPAWANKIWKDGKPYQVQFATDAEWLANSVFEVKEDGTLAHRSCTSYPTWPNNPEHRPYVVTSDRRGVAKRNGEVVYKDLPEATAQGACDELNAQFQAELLTIND